MTWLGAYLFISHGMFLTILSHPEATVVSFRLFFPVVTDSKRRSHPLALKTTVIIIIIIIVIIIVVTMVHHHASLLQPLLRSSAKCSSTARA